MSARQVSGRRSLVRRGDGFTLVEVMVALVVFAIGVLAMATLIPFGTRSATRSGESTRASEIASSAMERLLDTPYSDSELSAGAHTDTANPYQGSYYVTWNVEDDQPDSLCKRITITVRWPLATSNTSLRLVGITPESNWATP
jgi:type IV pilus assembly protein PilV